MGQVINHYDILEFPILDYSQILDEEAILSLHTILPMEESLNCLLLLVQKVDDGFGVIEGAGSEDVDVIVDAHVG